MSSTEFSLSSPRLCSRKMTGALASDGPAPSKRLHLEQWTTGGPLDKVTRREDPDHPKPWLFSIMRLSLARDRLARDLFCLHRRLQRCEAPDGTESAVSTAGARTAFPPWLVLISMTLTTLSQEAL